MRLKNTTWIPIILFLLILVLRLVLAFSQEGFTYDSYFTLRQAESIQETGAPLFDDPLSYGGRTFLFPPLFAYLIALLGFIISIPIAASLLTNLFYALLVPIAYGIIYRSTKHQPSAVFGSLLVGTLPVLMNTIFQMTLSSLAIMLFFLIIAGFWKLSESSINLVLLAVVALVITSPLSLFLTFVLLVYLLLLKFEGFTPNKKEIELALFVTFLALWSSLILYKKSLFFHGISILNQNIPIALRNEMFASITFLQAFLFIGILVLGLGIYGAYLVITKKESKQALIFISILLVFFVALLIQAIPLLLGLAMIGITLALLSGNALYKLHETFKTFKFSFAIPLWYVLLILLFTVFAILPALVITNQADLVTQEDLLAMQWIEGNTLPDDTILSDLDSGHLITYLAKRKNVVDTNYLHIPLINQRVEDIDTILSSPFQTDTVPLLRYYSIDYVYVSPRLKENYETIPILEDECMQRINIDQFDLYRFTCS